MRALKILLALLAFCGVAQAQTPGGFGANTTLSSSALNAGFASKADALGAINASSTAYGPAWATSADVSSAVMNAVAAAQGACVVVPPGRYPIQNALNFTIAPCIRSAAADWGTAYNTYSASLIFPTTFYWAGAATAAPMVKIGPTPTTGTMLQSADVEGIALDGMGLAQQGWSIISTSNSRFSLAAQNTPTYGLLFDTTTLAGGQSTGVQVNEISFACNNTMNDGDCIKVQNTNTNGNLSLNHFKRVVLLNRNGWGINIPGTTSNQADNNYFENAILYRTGSSGGINLGYAGQSHFGYLASAGGITVSAYSSGNVIDMYDTGNGSPEPVVALGGDIQWRDTFGHTNYVNPVGLVTSQQGNTFAISAQAIDTYNASPAFNPRAQLVCVDTASSCMTISNSTGTYSWDINIDGNTGDLRIVRSQGSGKFNIAGGATCTGAPDSNFRAVSGVITAC